MKTLQQMAARLSSASPLAAEVDRRMGVPSGAPSVSRDRVGRLTISSLQPVRFAQADDAPTSVTVPPWLALFAAELPPEAQRRLVDLARASDPFFADALDSLLRGAAESDGSPKVPAASPAARDDAAREGRGRSMRREAAGAPPVEGAAVPEWLASYAATLDDAAAKALLKELAAVDKSIANALEELLSGSGRPMRSRNAARMSRPSSGEVHLHRDPSGRLIVA